MRYRKLLLVFVLLSTMLWTPILTAETTEGEPVTEAPAEQQRGFVARYAGRALLTNALMGTAIGPWFADWNHSHVFNEDWPAHARFHNVATLVSQSGISLLALGGLWLDRESLWTRVVAAGVPIFAWGSMYAGLLVEGSGPEDPQHPLPRVAGMPLNIFVATGFVVTSALGLVLDLLWDPLPSE